MRRRNIPNRKFYTPTKLNNNIQEANVIDYRTFSKAIDDLEKTKLLLFDKAIKSDDPNVVQKAIGYFNNGKNENVNGEKIKSMLVDPLDIASSFGYKDKPTRLTYTTLQRMASTPFTAITLNTRLNQISKFCVPQPDEYSAGFKIRMRNRELRPTDEDKRNMEKITNFILDGGFGGYRWGRDDFETFMSKIMRDSLTYDQYTYEILENRKGIPQEFQATDAATYRIAYPDYRTAEIKNDPLTGQECLPNIVQIYQGGIENEFYPWELCFGVRRPRTDLSVSGYGFSELEELVNVVTSLLYSDEYNRRFFSQGSAPKGILTFNSSNVSETAIKDFKRAWQMQMSGVYNSWKTPILEAEKFNWIDLMKSNRDMEFTQWQNYNIKLHSAIFLIDASELGFDISRGDSGSSLFEGSIEKRIKYSRDKGLLPLLRNSAKNINKHLVWRIDNRYEFVFAGDEEDEDAVLDKSIKELSNFKTVDEVRAKYDLTPLGKENGGDLILNGSWISVYNNRMLQQANQQQDENEGKDFGDEGGSYNPLQDEEQDNNEEENVQKAQDNPFVKDLQNYLSTLN